ncbi:glycoside hydrolase family 3 N-terminal domain-containing protein [Streptomyces sp. RKAG293]|uniref:glycoside hydrolase family 3 N-terminal domain-containing protein n=1 Tax=Streptomyces sp. RKAG293 TaxID=2893403 RepID=UPI0020335894|nr:glycoside hydrolase family 3 N-terminal domain-containing protein [Streptomyces sp. RKAG293]MCM2422713.1 beta-N-acetylhexosaminidase [Streptomyces sp. RKAG293]
MVSPARWMSACTVLLLAMCTAARPSPDQASPAPPAVAVPAGWQAPAWPTVERRSSAPTANGSLPATVRVATAAGLSSQQLAGQRIVFSYRGLTPPKELFQAIRAGRAGGVVFFRSNITGVAQLRLVIERLKQAQQQSPVHVPLLLMVDQEGGLVRRLPGAPLLSERQIGQAADPAAAAAQAGTGAGKNLSGLGLNVNLAPVLDAYDTADNFIDKPQRSYSQSPAVVAAASRSFIVAQQRAGVAATAKHFPGLGSAPAGQNTDERAVTLSVPLTRLRAVDEAPYPAAINAGVDLVMLSWAVYPALDGRHPAGLSRKVVEGELRGRLGYRGVTVTDALEAGALKGVGTVGDRAVAAAAAGMDLLLCSAQDTSQGTAAAAALTTALMSGRLDRTTFADAVERVLALRAALR